MTEDFLLPLVNDIFHVPYRQIKFFCQRLVTYMINQTPSQYLAVALVQNPFVDQVFYFCSGQVWHFPSLHDFTFLTMTPLTFFRFFFRRTLTTSRWLIVIHPVPVSENVGSFAVLSVLVAFIVVSAHIPQPCGIADKEQTYCQRQQNGQSLDRPFVSCLSSLIDDIWYAVPRLFFLFFRHLSDQYPSLGTHRIEPVCCR